MSTKVKKIDFNTVKMWSNVAIVLLIVAFAIYFMYNF